MKYLVAVLMVLGGVAIAVVSLAVSTVPKGLQGWGLAAGVAMVFAGGTVVTDLVEKVSKR